MTNAEVVAHIIRPHIVQHGDEEATRRQLVAVCRVFTSLAELGVNENGESFLEPVVLS